MSRSIINIDWSQSHCGVMLCTVNQTLKLMPEVQWILADLEPLDSILWDDYLIDVKVHMLMPGQFPCIPNWHRDFTPRGEDGRRCRGELSDRRMWMWLSGPPLTEYIRDGKAYSKPAQQWHSFTQADVHRGVAATEHCWRCFIRVIPAEFVHPGTLNVGTLRRHSQVYLDAAKFTW
jgi:hypothetical protein